LFLTTTTTERNTMRAITITTRTLEPTDTKPKRVRVKTSDGLDAEYPWDHAYDAPEVHEHAALKAARLGNPAATATAYRLVTAAMGYTFRVHIEDPTA
jgi:hypothetical protein